MRTYVMTLWLALTGLLAAPAVAQPPVGESLLEAVRTGDVTLMAGLRGTRVRFSGAVLGVYRDTKAYRDLLVAADTHLAAAASGPLRFVVRIMGDARGKPAPTQVAGAAQVNDFEMATDDRKLHWYPVLHLE